MQMRVLTLFCAVWLVALSAPGQLVLTPAVPVAGAPFTVTTLEPGAPDPGYGGDCNLYFYVTGTAYNQDLSYIDGYGNPSNTFQNGLPYAGFYQANGDYGTDSDCESHSVGATSFAVIQAGVSAVSALDGQYAFLCQGDTTRGKEAAIGSFTADGLGNITAGVVDFNSPEGALLDQSLTGTYTLDYTGNGELALRTPTSALRYALRVLPLEVVSPLQDYPSGTTQLKKALLIAETIGEGVQSCTVGYGSNTPYGAYMVELSGETASTVPILPGVPIYGEQLLSFNGDNTTSSYGREFTASSPHTHDATIAGTFTNADPITGRVTFTLTEADQPTTSPTHFVAYTANATRIYVMSTDSHAKKDLVVATQPR